MSASRQITVNGQLFNGPDWIDGVEWEISEVTGFGEPESVFTSEQNVAQDGGWATTGFAAPRAVGLAGTVRAVDEVRAELAADKVRALFSKADFPVTLHYASGDRTVWVRRDGALTIESRELPTEFVWSVVLKGLDPAIYAGDSSGSADMVLSTGLPETTGGTAFPITFPLTFTGTSTTGDIVADLTRAGKLFLRIDGYVEQPQVIVDNAAGSFRLAWYSILDTGLWLAIDPQRQQALLQGQASRTPNVRLWPKLAPGVNTIRFRASTYSPTARLTATIRPTL